MGVCGFLVRSFFGSKQIVLRSYLHAALSFGLAAFVTLIALVSLARAADSIPTWVPIVLVAVSFVLLLTQVESLAQARYRYETDPAKPALDGGDG
jgi:hypothetical protein